MREFVHLITTNPAAVKKFAVAFLSAAVTAASVGLLDADHVAIAVAFLGSFGVYAVPNE